MKKMKFLNFLFVLLITIFFEISHAQQCRELFDRSDTIMMRQALLRGVAIFDSNKNYLHSTAFFQSYFHGTSVEAVSRSAQSETFLGSNASQFPGLDQSFPGAHRKQVQFAFRNTQNGESVENLKNNVEGYASLAAERFYIEYFFGLHRISHENIIYKLIDLFEILPRFKTPEKKREAIADFISTERDFFASNIELRNKLLAGDLSFFFRNYIQRKGVLVVIDPLVWENHHGVPDPDSAGSFAILTDNGIPWNLIQAIIPLSQAERNELLSLAQRLNQ